ncbi:hypothetical protein AVEN_137942-1 [Araneus ventricosus]|uniref:Uncharacterized protein n=1 Tax=Araneus ventricosus TaxID=182803 RepID=A0A4Y2GX73_ARAVE|nr:hypothetical protein AVEN_137942-1 [Araneus ventricosus]
MAARNGPNAVEEKSGRSAFQNKRGPPILPAQSRAQDLCRCLEQDLKTGVAVCGYMCLCDDFVTAFLKPKGSSFSLTNAVSSRPIGNC